VNLLDSLCDRCLTMYERDPSVLVSELCDRCHAKVGAMLFGLKNSEDFSD